MYNILPILIQLKYFSYLLFYFLSYKIQITLIKLLILNLERNLFYQVPNQKSVKYLNKKEVKLNFSE